MNATIQTDKTLYLLLGEEAVNNLFEGIEYFKANCKENRFDFELLTINNGDSFSYILDTMDGFFGYCFISEEDYKELEIILEEHQKEDIDYFNKTN